MFNRKYDFILPPTRWTGTLDMFTTEVYFKWNCADCDTLRVILVCARCRRRGRDPGGDKENGVQTEFAKSFSYQGYHRTSRLQRTFSFLSYSYEPSFIKYFLLSILRSTEGNHRCFAPNISANNNQSWGGHMSSHSQEVTEHICYGGWIQPQKRTQEMILDLQHEARYT